VIATPAGGCDAAPPGEVTAILRVELLDRLTEGPPPDDAYRATMRCAADTVEVSVAAPGGPARSLRTTVAGVPADLRARIVALAIAEIVRDLDRETPAPPPPPPPDAPARDRVEAPSPVVPSGPPATRGIDLGAFAQASTFGSGGAWLSGGGLRFDYFGRHVCAGLAATVLTMTERFELGTARAILSYGSPYVGWQERWGPVQGRLGAGYALGAARLSGAASGAAAFGGTTTGPWTALFAFGGLELLAIEALHVYAQGQFGWVTSPVVGEVAGGSSVALKGAWTNVQAGVALAF
jgi:hypothetical protein